MPSVFLGFSSIAVLVVSHMLNPLSFLSRQYRRRFLYPLLSGFLALSFVLGTAQVTQASLFDLIFPAIQFVQLSNISDRQEVQIGQQINQQLVRKDIELYRDPEITDYVNEIGQRIAQQSKRRGIPYTFQVVKNKDLNAFATMGGFVYLNTGLIAAADNEAQLASVLGHEIAHIAARHSIQQMRQQAIAQGLTAAAGLDRNTLVNLGTKVALQLPNSRKDEFQADQLGLASMKSAGYAPSAMVAFMDKLLKTGGSVPTFLSNHPATSDRIKALEQAIDPATADVGEGLDTNAYKDKIRTLLSESPTRRPLNRRLRRDEGL